MSGFDEMPSSSNASSVLQDTELEAAEMSSKRHMEEIKKALEELKEIWNEEADEEEEAPEVLIHYYQSRFAHHHGVAPTR